MVAVLMGDDDQLRLLQRLLHGGVALGPVGFLAAESEKSVHRLIHAGVDHDGAGRVDHLERGACGNVIVLRAAFDDVGEGTMAFGELDVVDARGLRARNRGGGHAHARQEVRAVRLGLLGQQRFAAHRQRTQAQHRQHREHGELHHGLALFPRRAECVSMRSMQHLGVWVSRRRNPREPGGLRSANPLCSAVVRGSRWQGARSGRVGTDRAPERLTAAARRDRPPR